MTAAVDEISDSADSKENVTPLKTWKNDGEGDTIEREEAVNRVIEDQQLIRAHNMNNDFLIRNRPMKQSRKYIISRNGVHSAKIKLRSSRIELDDKISMQITDL